MVAALLCVRLTSLVRFPGKYVKGERPWGVDAKYDIALPCATQNEVNLLQYNDSSGKAVPFQETENTYTSRQRLCSCAPDPQPIATPGSTLQPCEHATCRMCQTVELLPTGVCG